MRESCCRIFRRSLTKNSPPDAVPPYTEFADPPTGSLLSLAQITPREVSRRMHDREYLHRIRRDAVHDSIGALDHLTKSRSVEFRYDAS